MERLWGARRLLALGFGLSLALLLGLAAYRSSAATGVVRVYTSQGTAACNYLGGGQAPAVFQGQRISFDVAEFQSGEPVAVSVTFPDGRVFNFESAFDVFPQQANGLDGVIDQPLNAPDINPTFLAGDRLDVERVTGKMPYGCYIFTARGLSSGKAASGFFVVIPGGAPGAAPGPASFSVTRNQSNEAMGAQGSFVDLIGRNFAADERVFVWLTAPDGTVIDFPNLDANGSPRPELRTNNAGEFSATFQFTGKNPTGFYQFTAEGERSRFRLIAGFTLTSPPVQPRGIARFRVATPFPAVAGQGAVFQLVGELFFPGEDVVIWLTLPDGAVRELPWQRADGAGNFFADVRLDETLPAGFYQMSALGRSSNQLVIAGFNLSGGGQPSSNPNYSPEVVDTNPGGNTGTSPVSGDPTEYGNPGPRVAP